MFKTPNSVVTSNGVNVKRGELRQNWGALGLRPIVTGTWLTPHMPLPMCVTVSNLVVLRQRVYA